MNKINAFFPRNNSKVIKFMKKDAIVTQILHTAECYTECISNSWYLIRRDLISVPNMNKKNTFFSVGIHHSKIMKNGQKYSNV